MSIWSIPGIGGTNGRAPEAIIILRVVRVRSPSAVSTVTSQGEVMRALPCTQSTPSSV